MAKESLDTVLKYIHRIATMAERGEPGDAELLDRFATARDERAFALLVWRHGPMVFGLCRRMLRHEQDAEDVFQATFLTLARKANSIGKKESLASWLYKVAYRIACRARAKAGPATSHGAPAADRAGPDTQDAVVWRDLRAVLDEEVSRLPAIYSQAIVLCYLEGKTNEEAAKLLGCPKGTLAARLARGRERLCQLLTRRGVSLSVVGLSALLAENAGAAALSAEIIQSTTASALAFATGALTSHAAALAEGVLQMMWYSKIKSLAVIVLALVLASGGLGLVARYTWAGGGLETPLAQPEPAAGKPESPPPQAKADAAAEAAALRTEIAKLRADLKMVLQELKDVKTMLREKGAADAGPLYKGKPVSVWLEQYKDADPVFRIEAIKAIGVLAQKKKDLLPVLFAALNDDSSYQVNAAAAEGLAKFGEEIRPAIERLLKNKESRKARVDALNVLQYMGKSALPSVPLILPALQDPDIGVRNTALRALERIAPEPKVAMPALIAAMEDAIREAKNPNKKPRTKTGRDYRFTTANRVLNAILSIDQDLGATLTIAADLQNGSDAHRIAAFQDLVRTLKERYPPAKK